MDTLEQELKHDESYSLDFEDIRRIISGRAYGLTMGFIDLEAKPDATVEDAIKGQNVCAVLCTATIQGRKQRHWTCLIKQGKRLSYFESLGLGKKIEKLVDAPGWWESLAKHKAEFNTNRLQKESHAITTCGLHIIVRGVKHELTNVQYVHWLRSARSEPDYTVAMLTHFGHKS